MIAEVLHPLLFIHIASILSSGHKVSGLALVRGREAPFNPPDGCADGAGPKPRRRLCPCTPEERRLPMRIEIRTTAEEKRHWQKIAENKGVSLSELVRSSLGGLRLRRRREAPRVAPELLRELARIGNNLNQLAHAANRRQPLESVALLVRLIEIDRELAAIRAAHERPMDAD